MKRINFSSLSFFLLLFCVFSNQVVFADILIRKDPGDIGTQPNIIAPTSLITASSVKVSSASSVIPVSAEVDGLDLFVDFSKNVGTALVSVVDVNGFTVYMTVVNTYTTKEVAIPLDGLNYGKYSVKISYGSTKLIGNFRL